MVSTTGRTAVHLLESLECRLGTPLAGAWYRGASLECAAAPHSATTQSHVERLFKQSQFSCRAFEPRSVREKRIVCVQFTAQTTTVAGFVRNLSRLLELLRCWKPHARAVASSGTFALDLLLLGKSREN